MFPSNFLFTCICRIIYEKQKVKNPETFIGKTKQTFWKHFDMKCTCVAKRPLLLLLLLLLLITVSTQASSKLWALILRVCSVLLLLGLLSKVLRCWSRELPRKRDILGRCYLPRKPDFRRCRQLSLKGHVSGL